MAVPCSCSLAPFKEDLCSAAIPSVQQPPLFLAFCLFFRCEAGRYEWCHLRFRVPTCPAYSEAFRIANIFFLFRTLTSPLWWPSGLGRYSELSRFPSRSEAAPFRRTWTVPSGLCFPFFGVEPFLDSMMANFFFLPVFFFLHGASLLRGPRNIPFGSLPPPLFFFETYFFYDSQFSSRLVRLGALLLVPLFSHLSKKGQEPFARPSFSALFFPELPDPRPLFPFF